LVERGPQPVREGSAPAVAKHKTRGHMDHREPEPEWVWRRAREKCARIAAYIETCSYRLALKLVSWWRSTPVRRSTAPCLVVCVPQNRSRAPSREFGRE